MNSIFKINDDIKYDNHFWKITDIIKNKDFCIERPPKKGEYGRVIKRIVTIQEIKLIINPNDIMKIIL